MNKKTIIAIDGPAASGKGTLARNLAQKLGFAHLDTGALYRATAYEIMQAGGDPESNHDAYQAALALKNNIDTLGSDAVLSNPDLRTDNVGQAASIVAAKPPVRQALLDLQKNFASNPGDTYKGAVLDGRDVGTVVCPDADLKVFLIASDTVRAERRTKELQSSGKDVSYEAVLKDMRERDKRDAGRQTAPMKPADDAIQIDSSDLSPGELLEKVLALVSE